MGLVTLDGALNTCETHVADWGDGVSASCTMGPIVRLRGQWMAT